MNFEKNRDFLKNFFKEGRYVRWALLGVVTLLFIFILYPTLAVTRHTYKAGDVAERDIKAPKDFLIEDDEATEANRKHAAEEIVTVYDHDAGLHARLSQRVREAFGDLQARHSEARNRQKAGAGDPVSPAAGESAATVSPSDGTAQKKSTFEENLGITVSNGAFKLLEAESFSPNIADLIVKILNTILETGVVTSKDILLKESDKGILLRDVETKSETLVRNLKPFFGLDQAKAMVRIVGQPLLKDLNYNLLNLVVDFVQRLIQPNITLNRNETEERKKKAIAEIKPVLYKIKAGEMLLRDGERVTGFQLLKLKTLQSEIKKEQMVARCIGTSLLMVSLLMVAYTLLPARRRSPGASHNRDLLFMASMLVTFFLVARIWAYPAGSLSPNTPFSIPASSLVWALPLASGAMMVCLFLGLSVALPFALVLSVSAAIIFQNRFDLFIYLFLNGTMGAYWTQTCRERKVFIKAGLKLGALNGVIVTATALYVQDFSGLGLLGDVVFAFLGGIGAGILTSGIAPLVELAFDYTTDIKLLELANLDRPILHQLMLEAPGTYHHSVIVGSLVEAAAAEIGANPLLAKVCGYYHDIGKITKPLYFIENQRDGKNRHDKLAPSMSSLILIAHIKNGVEIARKNKLGRVITDTIRQHHGTSLIRYFYEKAKQLKGEDAVKIEDFRYPGPKPQTRETGLVMLADVVEAASRTLENPTPSRVQGLVQNLINKVFSDGQLDNCELTLKDLHNIAKSFNKILNGIYHHRIEYVESPAASNGKVKDGGPDRQPAKPVPDGLVKASGKSPSPLRRLGLS
jgi:putative nucleotidyltransferase with HDIG domain